MTTQKKSDGEQIILWGVVFVTDRCGVFTSTRFERDCSLGEGRFPSWPNTSKRCKEPSLTHFEWILYVVGQRLNAALAPEPATFDLI